MSKRETTEIPKEVDKKISRRTFLTYVNLAIGGFVTALLGIPLLGAAVLPALRKTMGHEVSVGSIADYQVNQPKAATVTITTSDGWIQSQEDRGVWVIKHSDTEFTVFNGRCVHLGCAYSWHPDRKEFICPCHGGTYTMDGKVVAGPPPRNLDTLSWKVQQGNLIVDYEDFRLGVPQKEAI